MARGATLESILSDARLEARLSPNAALNVQDRERQVRLIQREQERLWRAHDWPHLRVSRYLLPQAGQRYYDLAAAVDEAGAAKDDMTLDRIETVEVKDGGVWRPLEFGVRACDYAAHDSMLDERASPVWRWEISEDEQIELWPIPESDTGDEMEGYIRIVGIRQLQPLVDDDDRADLDNDLLALFTAAHLLASRGAPETQITLEAARKLERDLTGDLKKSGGFQMFGVGTPTPSRRRFVTDYKAPE